MTDGREITSVLVLRLSSVGDIVLTEPVVSALLETFPDAEIGYVVKSKYVDLVRSHPAITRVHALDEGAGALAALVGEVRGVGYSAVVDLHRKLLASRIVQASGAPVKTAYRKRELSDSLRVRVLRRPFRASRLLVRRYLDALKPLGVEVPGREPRLHVGATDKEWSAELLRSRGVVGGFAVVVPGSTWATKRWPAESYARLSASIVSELGLRVLLLGSEDERALCGGIARDAGPDVVSLAGETTLGRTAAVVSRASFTVANDSGPMHMSMALGVPTVGIFGPTDPRQFDFSRHALVYRDLDCSACSFYGGRSCRLGHWNCMVAIEPGEVLDAARTLLDRGETA